jgi:carboxypeptidase C (cathepsin A)
MHANVNFVCLFLVLGCDPYMQWLMAHPTFQRNPLYIAGDSYSGIVVPIIAQKVSDGKFCQSNLYKY